MLSNRATFFTFKEEVSHFLKEYNLHPTDRGESLYFKDYNLSIYPVISSIGKEEPQDYNKSLIIYRDLWYTKGAIIRDSLLSRLGKGEAIGARDCKLKEIDSSTARDFLENNHILGFARAKYHYALFIEERLLAVASFSSPRAMRRGEVKVNSYEWVRYASLGSSRVIGGMGKLLNHFIKDVQPDEVMSYADCEWGGGESYLKLGFREMELTTPIEFWIEHNTLKRTPLKKRADSHKTLLDTPTAKGYRVVNLGNRKFLLELYKF